MSERLWCTACGTVTDDMLCDCNRWPDDHEMKLEPHFVNYADAMQETAHEQAQEIDRLHVALEKIAGRREYDPKDHEQAAKYKPEDGAWTTDEYLADSVLPDERT